MADISWTVQESLDADKLRKVKMNKKEELMKNYKDELTAGFVTQSKAINPTDGSEIPSGVIRMSYKETDQMNMNKRLTAILSGQCQETFLFGTASHGPLKWTDTEFKKMIPEMESHEMGLFRKREDLEAQVEACSKISDIKAIMW